MNAGVAALHRVHSFLDIRACYLLVISGMAIIGALKAAGKMPHLVSKVGRSTEASLSVQVDPAWFRRVKLSYDEATTCWAYSHSMKKLHYLMKARSDEAPI